MVHQLEETLSQPFVSHFFESRIGIVLTVHGGPDKAKGLLTGVIDWYSPNYVTKAINQITADYKQLAPANATYYNQRHTQLLTVDLKDYTDTIAAIASFTLRLTQLHH